MAMSEISVRTGVVVQENLVSLSREQFRARIVYNARVDRYFMDLLDYSGNVLIQGFKLTANWNPFRNILVEGLPEGRIVILNRIGGKDNPTEDNFGFTGDCGFFYEPASTT